ncbi:MAG: preprotein translocase subunit SecA, partial [Dehalococcoidia bacterium]
MFKLFSGLTDSNEKQLKRLQPTVNQINELEPEFEKLSDDELRAKTDEFKARYKAGSSLDELLPEAFTAVREAAKRTIGQRHFDVQLMGGVVLHQGRIAEMKTGEGKTLVATLPLYLNSLTGQGCHLVTVNDYLARRDPYWMGPIYHKLGVSVTSIYPQQTPDEHTPSRLYDPDFDSGDKRWPHFRPIPRRQACEADITYGTSSEFGFDYLRDNMVIDLSQCVQRELSYAIVDEVDNLLIDEARTPLIISAPAEESGQKYQIFARFIPRLRRDEDYTLDEKSRAVNLTDAGTANVERMLRREGLLKTPNLYDPSNYSLTRYLESALKAHVLFRRDRDYVVKDGQVIIVDEFTGRLMFGRRYSEGLHQAIEAKEHVRVQRESRTFATITIQNYFRIYDKLAGMTGTAVTEAEEFHKIYKLEVLVIPTNEPMIREDHPDRIYKDEETKFRAVVREIEQLHKEERPVLIGTVSIEKSEYLSDLLTRKGIPHQVLNAKYHEKEAGIIAQAGQPGAVTVATNMAGRGVDIVLGGKDPPKQDKPEWEEWEKRHKKVVEFGGLHITGTERHEARRIDNQLRGRSGRQGDPGSSRFYVSLEDDIVKRFGGDRIKGFMEWAGMDEDTPIENRLVNRSIESAQVRVEGYHFDMRKHLVEYDDVVNQQREIIYSERKKILSGADLKANIVSMVRQELQGVVAAHVPDEHGIDWDLEGLIADVATIFPLSPALNVNTLSQFKPEQIEAKLIEQAEALYEDREKELGSDSMRVLERLVMLRIIDNLWVEHLTIMEQKRQDAGWQTLRQVRPVDAYKNVGYRQFQELLSTIRHDLVHTIYHVSIVKKEVPQPVPSAMAQVAAGGKSNKRLRVGGKKIGRNDPCPCGSGKKYKHC